MAGPTAWPRGRRPLGVAGRGAAASHSGHRLISVRFSLCLSRHLSLPSLWLLLPAGPADTSGWGTPSFSSRCLVRTPAHGLSGPKEAAVPLCAPPANSAPRPDVRRSERGQCPPSPPGPRPGHPWWPRAGRRRVRGSWVICTRHSISSSPLPPSLFLCLPAPAVSGLSFLTFPGTF